MTRTNLQIRTTKHFVFVFGFWASKGQKVGVFSFLQFSRVSSFEVTKLLDYFLPTIITLSLLQSFVWKGKKLSISEIFILFYEIKVF